MSRQSQQEYSQRRRTQSAPKSRRIPDQREVSRWGRLHEPEPRRPPTRGQIERRLETRRKHRRAKKKGTSMQSYSICRICLMPPREEGTSGKLITACNCSKENRYRHYQPCIGQWIETNRDAACRTCGKKYECQWISRWKENPSFWKYCWKALGYQESPEDHSGGMIGVYLLFQAHLLMMMMAAWLHRPSPDIWYPELRIFEDETKIRIVASLLAICVATIYTQYKRYLLTHTFENNKEPWIWTYLAEAYSGRRREHSGLYFCVLITAVIVAMYVIYGVLMTFGFFAINGQRVILPLINAVMIFFTYFGLRKEYRKYIERHHFPHDMVELRNWSGAPDQTRVLNISELERAYQTEEEERQRLQLLQEEQEEVDQHAVQVVEKANAFEEWKQAKGWHNVGELAKLNIEHAFYVQRFLDSLREDIEEKNEHRLPNEQLNAQLIGAYLLQIIEDEDIYLNNPYEQVMGDIMKTDEGYEKLLHYGMIPENEGGDDEDGGEQDAEVTDEENSDDEYL